MLTTWQISCGEGVRAQSYSCPPFSVFPGVDLGGRLGGLGKENMKKIVNGCEYYGRNKGKLSGQVPHCNFYFVALLVFLVKRFSIMFHVSNCKFWEHAPLILQPQDTSQPPFEKSWIRPCFLLCTCSHTVPSLQNRLDFLRILGKQRRK